MDELAFQPILGEDMPSAAVLTGRKAKRPRNLPPEIQRLQHEINAPSTKPPRRLAIGDELERLGDSRRGVGLDENGLPDIDWVKIPSGYFIYQSGEKRELPTYWISRYPITNRQFQVFVDDGGYREDSWWRDLKKSEPKASRWPLSNRPRTDVNWYEAVAFTRWLTARLGLQDGAIRLPTEYEWEKAARGEKGLVYPWGEKYQSGFANINVASGSWSLEQTTAVGLYPHGHSPYGVEDMSGTVWEWCLNKYVQPDVTLADTSGDSRGLRGGSWNLFSDRARADFRNRGYPDARYFSWGCRMLSSVPIAVR